MKKFYRVGNIENCEGLWYNRNGEFTGLIHKSLNFCSNCNLPMPFDKSVVGYLSAVDNIEDLYTWFTKDDIERLYPYGYRILEYESADYRPYRNHYLINQERSVLMAVFSQCDY